MTKLSMSEEEMLKRKYTRPYEKRIAELEEKISILLSCKNCPENKGGLICVKEYENKCLAQKIQYIKELEKENAELKEKLNFSTQYYKGEKAQDQLTKTKEIIKDLLSFVDSLGNYSGGIFAKAEQFLSEVEK